MTQSNEEGHDAVLNLDKVVNDGSDGEDAGHTVAFTVSLPKRTFDAVRLKQMQWLIRSKHGTNMSKRVVTDNVIELKSNAKNKVPVGNVAANMFLTLSDVTCRNDSHGPECKTMSCVFGASSRLQRSRLPEIQCFRFPEAQRSRVQFHCSKGPELQRSRFPEAHDVQSSVPLFQKPRAPEFKFQISRGQELQCSRFPEA
jgi:hypothetical protein